MNNTGISDNNIYIREAYNKIISLAIFAHASYIIIFGAISYWWLMVYNMFSTMFYISMLIAVAKGYFRLAVTSIHVEACIFVTVCIFTCGWDMGAAIYLPAMASLVYFCPFEKKYITYIFSATEMALYLVLRLLTWDYTTSYVNVDEQARLILYIYNSCAAFGIILYAGFISNVSATVTKQKLQEENESLIKIADYDGLTNLLTRRSFIKRMTDYLSRPIAIAMGDIDDFKKINDTYGHVCGDYVLTTIASVMLSNSPKDVCICRWGGEEFTFLFQCPQPEKVRTLMDNLRQIIEDYEIRWNGSIIHVTMTFGVAFGKSGENPLELIDIADRYMYIGKKQGKNRVISL